VLGTLSRNQKWIGEVWLSLAKTCISLWRIGLPGGSPDNVRCTGSFSSEVTALGNRQRRRGYKSSNCPVSHQRPRSRLQWRTRRSRKFAEGTATKNHQTVRWCTGLSSEPKAPAPTVSWSHRTVRCAPDSVRCANGTEGPTVGCAR
jgi:hypothetical protein